MNNQKIIITKDLNQIEALKKIKKIKDASQGVVTVDLCEASFPLTRDVFFALSERFHKDGIIIIVSDEVDRSLARTFGFVVELPSATHSGIKKGDKNIAVHNLTRREYFLYELRRGWQMVVYLLFEKLFKKQKNIYSKRTSPHFILIISGLIVSVTLLLFIFHFAVSKTTVYITPQISVRPVSANIIYSSISGSVLQGKNVLSLRTLSVPVETSMDYSLTVVDTNSTGNAEGIVTLYNEIDIDQALKPQTRLVTENGEVFRLKGWVNIPRSQTINGVTEIGSVEAKVVADGNDEAGRVIGVRGNIKRGTDLMIPGLKFNRDKVYAKAKTDFEGGIDPKLFVVTEAEIAKFKSLLREQLYRDARKKLQDVLDSNKESFGEDYALLIGEGITYTGEVIEMTSPYKFGDSATEVTLKGHVQVNALTYDRRATVDYLTKVFEEGLLRGTDKFIAVHPETLRVTNIVSRADDGSRIKATMEMTASTTYDFENATNELTRHMKVLIAGLSKEDATSRLINNGNIKEVDIEFSPFWIRTISQNIENIEFFIKK